MTENNETKTEKISKNEEAVKVDSMANVVNDLIKTKDTLIQKQTDEVEILKSKIIERSRHLY